MDEKEELANIFKHLADILAYLGEDRFKVRAYRRAAEALEELGEDVRKLAAEGKLQDVPGVGKAIARKIEEFLTTGRMHKYDEALRSVSDGIAELLKLPGLGPRTVAKLVEMGIDNPGALLRALAEGRAFPGLRVRWDEVKKVLEDL
ncbi:MAG TPA: hypothetical protein EYP61_08585 [Candidatus Latescibacteria bacterium]|nr:hypothetical protein [Candidatus Latescibacterota bacterium]